ncbi:MAG: glycosyltransferase family 2 protein, partial [Candidatus Zixiibacteriota bacterium]
MSGDSIKISVVVISFNGKRFIEDCLSSTIASFTTQNHEIIIIDNGSIDGSPDIIKSKFPELTLIENNQNLGFAPAVNQGLNAANGEYILILNQDTKIQDKAIEKLAERMKNDKLIGSIGPKFIGFDGQLQKCARAFPRYRDLLWQYAGLSGLFPQSKIFSNWKMGWFDHLSEREVDQPMGAALMITRKTVERVGYFDESFGIFFNDVDYCRRIREAGLKNLYYPSAVVAHYVGGSTEKMRPQMIRESHRSMYRYFKKYGRGGVAQPCLWFWGAVLYI